MEMMLAFLVGPANYTADNESQSCFLRSIHMFALLKGSGEDGPASSQGEREG